MPAMRDDHVARKLQLHDSSCEWHRRRSHNRCDCDWAERVHNTLLILKIVRLSERRECEAIARTCGGARAADIIRDRDQTDDER